MMADDDQEFDQRETRFVEESSGHGQAILGLGCYFSLPG